jgi:DNA-binding transcriptional MocR family regulator
VLDWENVFATRSKRMRASEIRELLKLLERPDIISFAGGIPDPALFPHEEFQAAYKDILTGTEANAALHIPFRKATSRCVRGLSVSSPRSAFLARKTMCSSHRVRSRR